MMESLIRPGLLAPPSTKRQHAVLSPSGAETWMNCPGSAAMQRGLPNDSNAYSDEGTAAHLLASTCLEEGGDASVHIGSTILVGARVDGSFDGAVFDRTPNTPTPDVFTTRRSYQVDADMADHVQKYLDKVREYQGTGTLMPERRISIATYTGEEGAEGTSDAAVAMVRELQVHDLKYGMGVRVNAKENKQLMLYGLGVREELDIAYGPFDRIRFVIHQPRLDHVDEWDCTSAELDAFGEEVKAAAAKALRLYTFPIEVVKSANEDALHPSEEACRWCKAKAVTQDDGTIVRCPALDTFVADTTAADFDAIEPAAEAAPMEVPTDAELLAKRMAAIPLIEDWCKAIRAAVESALFKGVPIPGWKVVAGKKGNRKWSDPEAAEKLLKDMRLTIEERCNLELKSPPQIEKTLKDNPKRWNRVLKAKLIEQRDGSPSVAPESDKRPVWTPPDTSNDFTATTEEESLV